MTNIFIALKQLIMKKVIFLMMVVACMTMCKKGYDNITDYANEEKVYPAKFDTIIAKVGYNRIELELLKAGRLPASKINMGKATKTVVEIYGETEPRVWDSVCSWVSITGLTEPRLYRFTVYTLDEFGNKSVPQEIAEVPFTEFDIEKYDDVPDPKISPSPFSSTLSWLDISTPMIQYVGIKYEYKDKDGMERTGSVHKDDEINFNMQNLEGDSDYSVDVYVRVIPLLGETPIIDTIDLKRTYSMQTLNQQTYIDWCKDRRRGVARVGWTNGATVFWQAESDPTQIYSVVKYTDYSDPDNPVPAEVHVLRNEEITLLSGIKNGEPISIYSIYSPPGSGAEVPTNEKNFNTLSGDLIECTYNHWNCTYTSIKPANDGFKDGNPKNVKDYNAHLDGETVSFLSMSKPGKSTGGSENNKNGGRPVYFVVDMKYTTLFNTMSWLHRNDVQGLMWWGLKLYGANEYLGLKDTYNNPTSNVPDPDNTQWVLIREVDFRDMAASPPKPPLTPKKTGTYDFPKCTYRYVKVELTIWDTANNSAACLSGFFLGYKSEQP